ncbi:RING finger protein 122 isoform 2-T2 [Clarias gariepinus]|uniref:RING finger protein 122 isoform X2 n=1 Tax=Clarias gariepinus TaxID=13013 RepID=UPI00234DA041|nr:RING finger protein 122 isoform X2 [Clarias gariepinus]
MQPFQWCNGCLCGGGLQRSHCDMSSEDLYHLPLNVYVIVLGIGLFIFMLSVIFCCYLFRLKQQDTRQQYSYNEVVLKGAGKKLSLLGVRVQALMCNPVQCVWRSLKPGTSWACVHARTLSIRSAC